MTPQEAHDALIELNRNVIKEINDFSLGVLRTRGGRFGSGMGTLLEALWGYYMNRGISAQDATDEGQMEIAWLMGHEYNDFACLKRGMDWNPSNRCGELLRIEAKSMNIDVDESKGHFDELTVNLADLDMLLVLLWKWEQVDSHRVYPKILDCFFGGASKVANLRDGLHLARGGSFVDRKMCPENCSPSVCQHHGEPLNAGGKRERGSGPPSRKPSGVPYAANFGGLVRMLKTQNAKPRRIFRELRSQDAVAHEYITFIHRNFQKEERNQYLAQEWIQLARHLGIKDISGLPKDQVIARVRAEYPNYQNSWGDIG